MGKESLTYPAHYESPLSTENGALYQSSTGNTPEMTGIKTYISTCSRESTKSIELFPRTENTH